MSFLAPKPDLPVNNNTPGRTNTQSPTQVVPLILGRGRAVVQWVTPVLHWHFRTGKTSQFAFFSGFGIVCLGPVDEIVQLVVNEKPYNGIHKFRADYPDDDYVDHTISKQTPEHFRIWWGLEDHANYSAYLQGLIRDFGHPMAGKTHPSYRGVCAIAIRDMEAGQSTGGQTPGLPKVELEVHRRSPTAYSFGYAAHGTHTGGVAKDILTLQRGGLGLPSSYFDNDQWTATLQQLMDDGIAGATGDELFTSHVFAEPRQADELLADVLSYFDGFVVERNGKLRLGYSPNDGSSLDIEGLTVINQHHLSRPISDEPADLDALPSQVIVTGLDWAAEIPLSEASETAQVPFARQLIGEQRPPQNFNRPGYTTRRQLKSSAALTAAITANPDWEASVAILRQYAVHPDATTPLRPGDLFVLNVDQVGGSNIVVRILERESDTPVETVYKVRRERGTFPKPYEPDLDTRASIAPPGPADLTRYTVKALPPALAVVPSITALVERPSTNVSSYEVHFSPTNSWPGQVIDTPTAWSVAAVNRTAMPDNADDITITVDTTGNDWPYLASTSALEQSDDRLLACHGREWFSVGTITPVGGGSYTVALKRARLDSVHEAHGDGDVFFFISRDLLPDIRHASFSDIYSGGVYDETTATKWFKLRPLNNGGDGNLTAAFSLVLLEADIELDDPNLYYSFIFKRAALEPATPEGDEPAGWTDAPPAGTDPLWMSRGVFRLDTHTLLGEWSEPVLMTGEPGNYLDYVFKRSTTQPATPTGDGLPAGWSDAPPAGTDPLWVSTGVKTAADVLVGAWSTPIRLNGVDGAPGTNGVDGVNGEDGIFREFVWKRAATQPATPTGNGIPAGWSDDPPAGSDPLWMSEAKQELDGTLVSGESWSTPIRHDGPPGADGTDGDDGDSVFVEYSVDGSTSWHSTFTPGDLYMRVKVGAGGAWTDEIRIVGEDGSDGESLQVEYSVDGSTSWHSTFTAGDIYMRQRVGSGAWSAAIRIVGEQGPAGAPGSTYTLYIQLPYTGANYYPCTVNGNSGSHIGGGVHEFTGITAGTYATLDCPASDGGSNFSSWGGSYPATDFIVNPSSNNTTVLVVGNLTLVLND